MREAAAGREGSELRRWVASAAGAANPSGDRLAMGQQSCSVFPSRAPNDGRPWVALGWGGIVLHGQSVGLVRRRGARLDECHTMTQATMTRGRRGKQHCPVGPLLGEREARHPAQEPQACGLSTYRLYSTFLGCRSLVEGEHRHPLCCEGAGVWAERSTCCWGLSRRA